MDSFNPKFEQTREHRTDDNDHKMSYLKPLGHKERLAAHEKRIRAEMKIK